MTMTRQVGPGQSLPGRLLRLCLRAAGDGRQGGEGTNPPVPYDLCVGNPISCLNTTVYASLA